jgi:DNA-binding NarL/FixJ family response regulator
METQNEVHFTPREMEIIKLLLKRNYRKQIGKELNIATGTVSNHIKHLYEKTETHCISELILYLLDNNFAVDKDGNVTYKGTIL